MQGTRLSIWRSAVTAYRDASHALWAMPLLTGVAFLVSLAEGWAFQGLRILSLKLDVSQLLMTMIVLLASFWRTPILIAVHRFVLLEEVTPSYRFDLSDPRFRRFLGWLLTIALVPLLATWFVALDRQANPSVVSQTLRLALIILRLALIILMIVGLVFTLRLTILLPAIAVDAPGASWRSAYKDTRGHVSRIIGIVLLAALPVLSLSMLLRHAAPVSAASFTPLAIGSRILNTSINVFCTIALVAIVSRVYQRIGDRVNQRVG